MEPKILVEQNIWSKNFGETKIRDPKISSQKEFLCQKKFGSKILGAIKLFGSNLILGPQKFCPNKLKSVKNLF